MKQHWQRIALNVDALSLRERAIIFALVALIVIVLINTTLLDPRFAKQKQLSQRIKKDRSVIAGLQVQIQEKTASVATDPDKANKLRLQELKAQTEQVQNALSGMEKAMVSPDMMAALLADILKQNHSLHLVSLKNLPPSALAEAQAAVQPAENMVSAVKGKVANALKAKPDASVTNAVYKHGVEIVVQGSYLDLMNYLAQMESMPWQLMWGQAKLDADNYPRSTLTLTVFTLSLEKKWLNL